MKVVIKQKLLIGLSLFMIVLSSCGKSGSSSAPSNESDPYSDSEYSESSHSESEHGSEHGSEDESEEQHVHTFAKTWAFDEATHWHPATCGHDVKSDVAVHDFTYEVVEPTYESDGYVIATCQVCRYVLKSETIDKLEHHYSNRWSYDDNGHWHMCLDEGYSNLYKDYDGHTLGDWKIDIEPEEEKEGREYRECEVCGYKQYRSVDPLPHTHKFSSEWTSDDNFHWHASTCGHDVVSEKAEHTYDGDWIVYSDPTDYEPGSHYKVCSVCGYKHFEDYGESLASLCDSESDYEISLDGEYYIFYKYNGERTKVVIPETHLGKPVREIYDYAFSSSNSDGVEEVVIPNSVNKLGNYPFSSAYGLKKITLREGNEHFSTFDDALYDKETRTLLAVPHGKEGSINLPKELEALSNSDVFTSIDGLDEIIVDEENEYFSSKDGILYDKEKKTLIVCPKAKEGAVVVPNTVEEIGDYAFYNRDKITSVTMNEGVKKIGIASFYSMDLLTSIRLPNTLEEVGQSAFSLSKSLTFNEYEDGKYLGNEENNYIYLSSYDVNATEVAINTNCKIIGTSAISTCNKLTSVSIPNSVTQICDVAISSCSELDTVYIGKNVSSIERICISCPKMLSFVVNNQNETYKSINGVLYTNDLGTLVRYPSAKENVSISEQTKHIGNYAFYQHATVNYLTLPSSIKTIGDYAFNNSQSLEYIIFNDGLEVIGRSAFYSNKKLQDIVIPDSVTTICSYAFYNCSSMSEVEIGSGLKTLASDAFDQCSSLASVSVSSNNKSFASQDGILYDHNFNEIVVFPRKVSGDIVFPDNLKALSISDSAQRSEVTSITIGKSTNYVSLDTLLSFNNLTNIEVSNDNNNYTSQSGILYNDDLSKLIRCPVGKEGAINLANSTKEVGDSAFYLCRNVKSIVGCEQLTSIGSSAFYGCTLLDGFNLSNEAVYIGDYAFDGCTSITSVTIPASVKEIKPHTFYSCTKLANVTFEEGLESIGERAFSNTAIVNANLPDSLKEIGSNAFYSCSCLETVYLGKLLRSIEGNPFANTKKLRKFDIYEYNTLFRYHDGILYYQYIMYEYWGKYLNIVDATTEVSSECEIESDILSIYDYAFYDKVSLTSLTFNDKLESIGSHAFYSCDKLEEINLPDSLSKVGDYAFAYCPKVTSIHIGKNLTSDNTASNAFNNLESLESITLDKDNTGFAIQDHILYDKGLTKILAVPVNLEGELRLPDTLKSANLSILQKTNITSLYIGANLTSLTIDHLRQIKTLKTVEVSKDNANYASEGGFLLNKDKTQLLLCPAAHADNIVIPDSVTSIESQAFYYNKSITTIDLNNVVEIKKSAFSGCTALASITWSDVLKVIGETAFYNIAIEELELPDSVEEIGLQAFASSNNLASITLSESLKTLSYNAFDNCSKLYFLDISEDNDYFSIDAKNKVLFDKDVTTAVISVYVGLGNYTLPDTVTSVADRCFVARTSLTSIFFSSSLKSIGVRAFYSCSQMTSMTSLTNVTSIGDYAFYNCTALDGGLKLNSVESLGTHAFYNCKKIASVDFEGSSLEAINERDFYNCSGITSVAFSSSLKKIGQYAFYNCTAFKAITLNDELKEISDYAFYGSKTISSLILPDSLLKVGDHAFDNATVTSLYIGKGLNSIGVRAFANTQSMTTLTIDSQNTYFKLSDSTLYDFGKTFIYFHFGSDTGSFSIPSTVKEIGDYAFTNSTLTTITISAPVKVNNYAFSSSSLQTLNGSAYITYIGAYSFYQTKIASFTINPSVESIGQYAFYRCSSITSFVIPDNVTSVGSFAFYGCTSLIDIIVGNGITVLPASLFYGCSSLEDVTLPEGLLKIETNCFYNCSALASISLPDTLTSIGSNAFFATGLTSINIGKNVSSIDSTAFSRTTSLTSFNLDKDNKYYSFQDDCLYNYNKTTLVMCLVSHSGDITILDSVTTIEKYAFYYCSSLTSVVISSSVTTLDQYAFAYCGSLTSVAIGSGLTSISAYSFQNCSKLTSINIPSNIESIGSYAFSYCSSLTEARIPSSVTKIDNSAFYYCSALANTYVTIDSFEQYFKMTGHNNLTNVVLLNSKGNELTIFDIPGSVGTIPAYAFYNCKNIMMVTIESGVTSIKQTAFYNCKFLISVSIPNTVTEMQASIFDGCLKLATVNIPTSLDRINNYMFRNCTSLESITIPDSVTLISDYAFSGCTALVGITGGAEVLNIGIRAFSNCTLLATSPIGSKVQQIGNYAFYSCSALKSVALPDSLLSIGNNAFAECSKISTLTFGKNITSIGENCFYNCKALTSVTLPSKITEIAKATFYGCTSLTSVYISINVTSIGANAFYNCASLSTITYAGTVSQMGNVTKGSNWNYKVPATYITCEDGKYSL